MNNSITKGIASFLILHSTVFMINLFHTYSQLSNILFYLTPMILLIYTGRVKKLKFKIIFSIMIILISLLSFTYSFLSSGLGQTTYIDTKCTENIKIAKQYGIFSKINIVEKHLFGLIYIRKNISSENTTFDNNYNPYTNLKFNRKNFYNPYEFEFYSNCLPFIGIICPDYFIFSETKEPCKE